MQNCDLDLVRVRVRVSSNEGIRSALNLEEDQGPFELLYVCYGKIVLTGHSLIRILAIW